MSLLQGNSHKGAKVEKEGRKKNKATESSYQGFGTLRDIYCKKKTKKTIRDIKNNILSTCRTYYLSNRGGNEKP